MLGPGFYNLDSRLAIKQYPDKYFDLAIIDPPYGIKVSKQNITRGKLAVAKGYKPFHGEDEGPPSSEFFSDLLRVSKHAVIWGANHFISRIPYDASCWIVWDKDNGNTDFADCELAWTNLPGAVRKFTYCWAGMRQQDMKNKEVRIHPTQKPVALYEWILDKYSRPGDLILDTHVGSASGLIACRNRGLQYVGFEIDKYYYDLALKRLREAEAQYNIFDYL